MSENTRNLMHLLKLVTQPAAWSVEGDGKKNIVAAVRTIFPDATFDEIREMQYQVSKWADNLFAQGRGE